MPKGLEKVLQHDYLKLEEVINASLMTMKMQIKKKSQDPYILPLYHPGRLHNYSLPVSQFPQIKKGPFQCNTLR